MCALGLLPDSVYDAGCAPMFYPDKAGGAMEQSGIIKKGSFVFYRSWADSINLLPPAMQLPLYKAITSYALDLKEPSFDEYQDKRILEAFWATIKPLIDANHLRYINGCKGRSYGHLGGAPLGNANARKKKQPQNNPKTTPNDNVNINENINDNVVSKTKTTSSKEFVKPTVEDVRKYCESKGYKVDAASFFDYYEGNGWMVGQNPMKDWTAALRTWERKEAEKPIEKGEKKVISGSDIFDLYK